MTPARCARRLRRILRRFRRDRGGVSAVEFAILLPFMLTLYIGGVELGDGMAVQFKSTLAARTVTDLASQYVTIDGPEMTNILGAASTVVTPYSAANMVVTLSELTVNSNGQGVVQWSCSLNGTARAVPSNVTMPSKLQTNGITLLYGEVTYPYTPSMGYVVTGTINIYESVFFFPRMSTAISLSACS